MKHKTVFFTIGILTAILVLVTGCNSGSTSLKTSTTAGRLIVNITDAPSSPEIQEVWLTITGLQVHMAGSGDSEEEQEQEENASETENQEENKNQNEDNGGWIRLPLVDDGGNSVNELEFNLLEFFDGSQAKLSIADLDAGKYTQLRMDVELVELKVKDVTGLQVAKLPSNVLKFNHPFEIVNGGDTVLLFDFDALKSVVYTGSQTYIFKPVVNIATVSQPVFITTPSLPNGELGVVYTATTLAAVGGSGNYTWGFDTGSALPADLNLNTATGEITGTPNTALTPGIFSFTIKVVDNSVPQQGATKTFSIEIAASGALQIITTSLPDGLEDVAYSASLVAIGGTGYQWELSPATGFPPGLGLSTGGIISGTPTDKGDYSFTVKVTDDIARTDTQVITVSIK